MCRVLSRSVSVWAHVTRGVRITKYNTLRAFVENYEGGFRSWNGRQVRNLPTALLDMYKRAKATLAAAETTLPSARAALRRDASDVVRGLNSDPELAAAVKAERLRVAERHKTLPSNNTSELQYVRALLNLFEAQEREVWNALMWLCCDVCCLFNDVMASSSLNFLNYRNVACIHSGESDLCDRFCACGRAPLSRAS
jgi:hypothetical protein